MYKFLLKPSANATSFRFYKVTKEIEQEDGSFVKTVVDYETDDLDEMAEVYKELLSIYPSSQVVPIHNLTVELTTIISE